MDLQEVNILINIRKFLLEKNDKQKLELVDSKINALLGSQEFMNYFNNSKIENNYSLPISENKEFIPASTVSSDWTLKSFTIYSTNTTNEKLENNSLDVTKNVVFPVECTNITHNCGEEIIKAYDKIYQQGSVLHRSLDRNFVKNYKNIGNNNG